MSLDVRSLLPSRSLVIPVLPQGTCKQIFKLGASQLPCSGESAGAAGLFVSAKQIMIKATVTVHFSLSAMY